MPTCIICRKEKEAFSVEHIIPDAIGGCYLINNVCKECNSILGTNVDIKLVNHIFTKHIRFFDGITGKTGKKPNPFEGTYSPENDESEEYQMIPDKDYVIRPYLLPKVKDEKISEDEYLINISVDDKDLNKVEEIISKKLQRLGLNTVISREAVEIDKKGLTFSIKDKIDLEEYKICLLKIAYEFAVSKIPDYFHDEMADEISQILKNTAYDKVRNYVHFGDGFTKDFLAPFGEFLDFESKKHYLILLVFENKLYCYLSIFNTFFAGIQLSNKPYLPKKDTVICINDYIKKTYTVTSLLDIIGNPANCSYTYAFQSVSERDEIEYNEKIKEGNSPFYYNENGLLLYDHSGEKILNDEMSLLIDFLLNRQISNYNGTQMEIPVPDGHFVKMKSNNKTIRLTRIIEKKKKN